MKTNRSLLAFAASAAGLCLFASPAIPIIPTILSPRDSVQKPQASPAGRTGSYRPPTWPKFIRLPDDDFKNAAPLARFIADHARQYPGSSIVIALTRPPAAAEVARSLPAGAVRKAGVSGSRLTLASGATVTLFKVKPGETDPEASLRAFPLATVSREQLVPVLKDLPANATVTVEKPGSRPLTVTGDISRAVRAVRAAPSGTVVRAKWGKRSVRYPRLE